MTIDERLERLTERHEAVTQTVEIIAHQIDARAGRVGALVTLHDRRITKQEGGEQR